MWVRQRELGVKAMAKANSRLKEQKYQAQDQNKSNPEEQGASQWAGWGRQRKDRETAQASSRKDGS